MRVIIAGSREITDYSFVASVIKRCGFNITEVVSGTAHGVDRLGEQWAVQNNVPIKYMPPDWNLHGKAAGPIRNKEMAEYADAAVIIWNGESAGTKNMLENMQRLGKPYFLDIKTRKDVILNFKVPQ